jgi:deoxyribonuclease V
MGNVLHAWNLSPAEAVRVQLDLRPQLVPTWNKRQVETVGGVDVSTKEGTARCAIVVMHYPELKSVESATADVPLTFPYIPGLLAFREGPAILAAWENLKAKPDLLMFDGQGIAHPRGIGIASLMGLWLNLPTIGVAKSRLYGRHEAPGQKRGDRAALYDDRQPEQVIGAVVRTRDDVKPLYISPGHLIDVEGAVAFTLACGGGYRLPETTRWAHRVAGGAAFPSEHSNQTRLF